jgi:glutaredoxin 3
MIELYTMPFCPYCRKVKSKLTELDLEYDSHRVSMLRPLRTEVQELSGQNRVPVLIDTEHGIDGMAESDDIIAYLEKTYGSETK